MQIKSLLYRGSMQENKTKINHKITPSQHLSMHDKRERNQLRQTTDCACSFSPREVVDLLELEQAAQLVGLEVGARPHQVEVHAVRVSLGRDGRM